MKASAGGLALLHAAECRLGLVDVLAGCIREQRAAERLVHTLLAALHSCMFLIACGAACLRGGEAGPEESRRRLRRSENGFAAQSSRRPGAGERSRSLFAAYYESVGERALAQRAGVHDGCTSGHLLPLLPDPGSVRSAGD